MRVSFILPAHDEQDLIGRAVESIKEATADLDAEIIVSDDASTDGTGDIARAHGAQVVRGEHRQIAAARNHGAAQATGDLLIFVDGDSAVTPELVRQTIDAVQAGAVGGGSRCRFDGEIPLWARLVARVVFPMYALAGLTPGAYIFATRQAFDAVGGFDETLFGGEEVFFARAVRRQGRFRVVRAAVLTSGRKLRLHSGWELLFTLTRLGLRGKKGVTRREGLELWYGPRQADPGRKQL